MQLAESSVFIIDDDQSIRRGLGGILRSVGLQVSEFESADAFLQSPNRGDASCLVLDVRLPGLSGLALQARMSELNLHIPIVMITGHGDIPMSVRALKAGAVDFLTKPFRDQEILDAVYGAIERDRVRRSSDDAAQQILSRFRSLTAREREIIMHVCQGAMNKQIAADLGVSEITVKIHRGRVMRKMGARSLADLVRMGEIIRSRVTVGDSI
jgi:FixJ family two-component response regulator